MPVEDVWPALWAGDQPSPALCVPGPSVPQGTTRWQLSHLQWPLQNQVHPTGSGLCINEETNLQKAACSGALP